MGEEDTGRCGRGERFQTAPSSGRTLAAPDPRRPGESRPRSAALCRAPAAASRRAPPGPRRPLRAEVGPGPPLGLAPGPPPCQGAAAPGAALPPPCGKAPAFPSPPLPPGRCRAVRGGLGAGEAAACAVQAAGAWRGRGCVARGIAAGRYWGVLGAAGFAPGRWPGSACCWSPVTEAFCWPLAPPHLPALVRGWLPFANHLGKASLEIMTASQQNLPTLLRLSGWSSVPWARPQVLSPL